MPFYGTKYDIWADFGPIGNEEKTIWAYYEQLLRVLSKNVYFRVHTKKLH